MSELRDRRKQEKREKKMFDKDDLQIEEQSEKSDNTPNCSTGKMGWKKPSKAASIARVMRVKYQDGFIEHYFCEECSHYHIGHPPGSLKQINELVKYTKKNVGQ